MRELAVVISNDNKEVTPFETMDAIKKAGFKQVFIQWYHKDWKCSEQAQLEYAKQLGFTIIFAHLGYKNINAIWEEGKQGDQLVEEYKKDIKTCKENGIPMVVMHLTSGIEAPHYNELGLKRIKEIVEEANRIGIKVAFENTKIKGYLEYVLEHINLPNVGICYDAGHCHVHFKDEFPFEQMKDRIFAVHLHDNDQSDDLHLLPFDGTINWKTLIENLKYCHYNGPITMELCYRYQYLEQSIDEFFQNGYQVGEKLAKLWEEA